MTTTFERLSAILSKDFKLPPGRLTLDAPLESLGIDSLGTVELFWHIEDSFKIKLPAELVVLPTLGDVVLFIEDLVARQSLAATPVAPPAPPASSARLA